MATLPRAPLRRLTKRFLRARHGASAVEFALISPVLLLIFVATIDLSRAVTAANRASFVADTIAELVSQADHTLSSDELDGFMLLAPLIDPDALRYGRQTGIKNLQQLVGVTISSVAFSKTEATCTAGCNYLGSVVFSRSNTTANWPCGMVTARPDDGIGKSTTIPTSLFGPDSLVVVDVVAYFRPLFLTRFSFLKSFNRTSYYRPRTQARINSAQNCSAFSIL